MKKSIIIALLSSCLMITGCNQGIPPEALQLSQDSLQLRQLQTRSFDTLDEKKILIAGAAVLQDLGYTIDESQVKLGVISASKMRDARETGQIVASIFVAALGGGYMPTDKEQKIKVSLITRPNEKKINARLTVQRTIWNTQGQITTIESVKDAPIYQEFFEKLSKSVFLTANQI